LLDGLIVTIAENQLSVTGSLGATVALDVAIDARRLDRLTANAAGALHAAGHVAGTLAEPTLTGSLNGQDLRYGDFGARTLAVSGEVVADESRAIQLDLSANGLMLRGRSVDSATAAVSGTAGRHTATLALSADDADAQLRASGSWVDGTWSGELTEFEVDEPAIGVWALTDATRLELGRGRFELERACLTQRETRLCAVARIGTDTDMLDLELNAFDLAVLSPFLPNELSATGRYDASLRLTGPLQRPAGTFAAHGAGTVFSIRELDEPALDIALDTIDIEGSISDAGDLNLAGELRGRTGARVAVDADVTRLWDADRQLRAAISGQWEDLGMLSLLSPDVGDVSGTASVDLVLEGPPRSPAIRGDAQWSNGRVEVPRWGLIVEDIDAVVSSPDGTRLLLQASGLAGEGRIDVTGVTEVDAQRGWPTELRVFGNGLQAVRLPDADILVSPALEVRAALPDVDVSGAFLIPYARLELEGLPPQAVRPSVDTVVHGVDRPAEEHPLNVHADIRVGFGDDVRYAGAGLDVALSGAMGLVYDSGRAAVASGSVTLTGQYQAYGQNLDIDEGQLIFAGPVANPNLDVRAVRRIEPGTADVRLTETTVVGVELSGTVEAPIARVFSEPAMNEADALSYLLLGRPLSASGDEETATLESAAFTMGLQQALPVIQRVGETLGLDEFSVQTTSADTGELMAGKRISPRLYVRYTYGLFNRIGGLLMRFDLSERYSLETRSGDNRSMDLIYTVERD
jgi:translocation and assembly module TamB